MAKLVWHEDATKTFETGVDRGVLFVKREDGQYGTGVAWQGLTAVSENPSGGEDNKIYADNVEYLTLTSRETFAASIEAYTYPEEFEICDGSKELVAGLIATQQSRRGFGFTYRTLVGNDVVGEDYGYKLHIVYNAKALPSQRGRTTINENPEALSFSWEVSTTAAPAPKEGMKPLSHYVIDSIRAGATKMKKIEDKLYGTSDTEPTLPTPAELLALLSD